MDEVANFEARVRREAMLWLTLRSNDGYGALPSEELRDFSVDGQRIPLLDMQRGIRKPRDFAAALSIRTVYVPPGKPRPYDDDIGPDGLLRYKWRGSDPDHAENRALRAAMLTRVPLIWFFGVGPGVYLPRFPIYLLWEEPDLHQFTIDADVARDLISRDSVVEAALKRYVIRETRQRLHQPVFRSTVLRAYDTRCTVCSLHHPELLDAAHIIADREEGGIASVTNGLAMCKIHHAAFDRKILGIRPDRVVEIRSDLLDEIDGPMLKYGLQERHNQSLMVLPHMRREWPDTDLLEAAYEGFRDAG